MTVGRALRRGVAHVPAVAVVAMVAGIAAFVVSAWFARPFRPVMIGSDTASSVLYFERIVHGEVLERFLGTTPKPLLTLVDGAAHGLTGDWRAIAWIAVLVYAAAVAATALLAGRTAGPPAGAFVAAGLIANEYLTQDVLLAYAVSWALLALALAGLAVTAARPRWALAGGLLALGALARQEVLLVTGATAVLGVVWWIRQRPEPISAGRGILVLVLIGLVALPLTGLHDWLLTRDPLYSLRVPALGAEGRTIRDLTGSASFLLRHLWDQAPFLLLAVAGCVAIVRDQKWSLLVALAVFGPGVALFFLAVAARGLVPLDRYLAPMDLAVVFAAAIGVSTLRLAALPPGRLRRAAPHLAVAGAVVIALALAPTIGPLDRDLAARARQLRVTAAAWQDLLPEVRAAAAEVPALRAAPADRDASCRDLARPALLVSAGLLPIAAVDLGLTLDRVARLENSVSEPADLRGMAGSLIYHAPAASISADLGWLEISRPTTFGEIELQPVASRPTQAWLLRVAAAPGPDRSLTQVVERRADDRKARAWDHSCPLEHPR